MQRFDRDPSGLSFELHSEFETRRFSTHTGAALGVIIGIGRHRLRLKIELGSAKSAKICFRRVKFSTVLTSVHNDHGYKVPPLIYE